MSKYIDVNVLTKTKYLEANDVTYGERASITFKEIEMLPSIDIVRCGECMHNGSYDTDCPFGWRKGEWNMPKPCDFCSYGKRESECE